MNSEELEQSLRTEFESYLKNVLSDLRQEASQLQQKIETEFENHKSHLDEVLKAFSSRVEQDTVFDEGFKESIGEHLRLARDEGATITATAIAEAEELAKAERKHTEAVSAVPSADLSDLRNAIYDISSQNSQSTILKALIDHASKFTPRGAFFVVKNQHFVGWRVFGSHESGEDTAIGEVVFPVSSSTALGDAVRSLSVVESAYGNYKDDAEYLVRLDFGKPTKMYAIPLIARGRGVAAIYADCGENGDEVNVEALESLVSVAGLTVELLASAQTSQYTRGAVKTAAPQQVQADPVVEHEEVEEVAQELEGQPDEVAETESVDFAESEVVAKQDVDEVEEVEFGTTADTAEIDDEFGDVETESYEVSEAGAESEQIDKPQYEVGEEFSAEDASFAPADEAVEEVSAPSETAEVGEIAADEAYEAADTEDEAVAASDAGEEAYELVTDAPEPVSVSEPSSDAFESAAAETDAEYDDLEFQPAVETIDTPESFSVPEPSEPQFETNQDFNSSPVQFEQSAETSEPEEVEVAQEVAQAAPEEVVEEVAAAPIEAAEPVEVASDTEAASPEVVEPVTAPPIKTRFSDRNVELPIDVSEEERRLHNDARRFARLLVSEIKLYNEQKVKEGRESNDLYERLHEAIDRSREMYDKRVQPTVVKRFDYFHYEVVNNLADGEEARLGSGYPGSTP